MKGMLVDYYYCSGCHTCEIACGVSHDLPNDESGVLLRRVGPFEARDGSWEETFIPFFTKNCNQCREGEAHHNGMPMCVEHCQSRILKYGELDELALELAAKPNQMLYALA